MRRGYNTLLTLALWVGVAYGSTSMCSESESDVYQFNLTAIDDVTPLPLEQYRGKVLVIFNSATYWGKGF